jgi:hypothetical protein
MSPFASQGYRMTAVPGYGCTEGLADAPNRSHPLVEKALMPTAESIYETTVAALPKSEQLKLAARILEELAASGGAALDFSDSWSEEDLRDVTAYAADYAARTYGEDASGA